jgi:formiminoglutamate deiminase
MKAYWAEHCWLPTGVASRVRIDVSDGRITGVRVDVEPAETTRLPGLVVPGFANGHSHAFHRALRGRTHLARGDFWSWRDQMYRVAARLDPDNYLRLATAVFAEMALAGVTCVGEFHYVHHRPDGRQYDNPNVMAEVLREAAHGAGIRLTLLDTCYLTSGIGVPLTARQRRFSDRTAEAWATRFSQLHDDATMRMGAAIHSVRAVPRHELRTVVDAATGKPLHIHVSEQLGENVACEEAYGRTPTQLLHEADALSPMTTVVHATHATVDDISLLADRGVAACLCPTTERDLGDGVGPAHGLHDAGVRLCVGTDQHAMIDLFEEARELEMHERLRTGVRGVFQPGDLVDALTKHGHAALGWPEAGHIHIGALADLVAVRLDSVRTAGVDPAQAVYAATAADIDTVIVGGREVVRSGQHVLGGVGSQLNQAIATLWTE